MTSPAERHVVVPEFTQHRRTQIAEMRPFVPGETLRDRVSISKSDLEAGSPKLGDMIARNPANHEDQWLIAADYFAANFEPLSAPSSERDDIIEMCAKVADAKASYFGNSYSSVHSNADNWPRQKACEAVAEAIRSLKSQPAQEAE